MSFSAVMSALAERPRTYSLKRSEGLRFRKPRKVTVTGLGLRPLSIEGDLDRVMLPVPGGERGVMSNAAV